MKNILTVIFIAFSLFANAQKKKTYFPAWTFQQRDTRIYGLSVGLWNFYRKPLNTTTNGLRIALIGEGILVPMAPRSPIPESDSLYRELKKSPSSERINGICLSGSGNMGEYNINGIALGFIGQANTKLNGISAGLMMNFALAHNGIQLSVHRNECYAMNGIQIGIVNISKRTRGIQLGLWNKNEKRKLPIINWNF